MISRIRHLLFILLIFPLLFSCDDDDDEENFPSSTGIKGRVLTQNEFQQPLYDERNGVELFIEVGFREFSVGADNVGQWQLPGAPVGTYTFTVSKEGFGTIVRRGVRISTVNPEYPVDQGSQKIPTFVLTKLPDTAIEDVMLDLSFQAVQVGPIADTIWTLDMTGSLNPGPPPTGQAKGFRVFLGLDEFVSPEDYVYQEHFTTTEATFDVTFNDEVFNQSEIGSGDVIYALVYADANFNQEIELQDGTMVFPNLAEEPGEVVSVALP